MSLIYESRIEREVPGVGDITVEAWATGRPESRGAIAIRVSDCGEYAQVRLAPQQAIALAAILVELADKATRFSTRGFVGSTE